MCSEAKIDVTVRKAFSDDAESIVALTNIYSENHVVLPRTVEDVVEHIANFVVVEDNEKLIGCCACRDFGNGLFEIRSLVVDPQHEKRGLGRLMVELIFTNLPADSKRVFALTYKGGFFKKLGFHLVSKEIFPQKIWSDCINCPNVDCCDEEAYLRIIKE